MNARGPTRSHNHTEMSFRNFSRLVCHPMPHLNGNYIVTLENRTLAFDWILTPKRKHSVLFLTCNVKYSPAFARIVNPNDLPILQQISLALSPFRHENMI